MFSGGSVTPYNADGARLGFGDLEPRAVGISVNEVEVRLAGLGDIIDSKRFAGRDKDLEALPELEWLEAQQPSDPA